MRITYRAAAVSSRVRIAPRAVPTVMKSLCDYCSEEASSIDSAVCAHDRKAGSSFQVPCPGTKKARPCFW